MAHPLDLPQEGGDVLGVSLGGLDPSVWLALLNRNRAPHAIEQNLPITSRSPLTGYGCGKYRL